MIEAALYDRVYSEGRARELSVKKDMNAHLLNKLETFDNRFDALLKKRKQEQEHEERKLREEREEQDAKNQELAQDWNRDSADDGGGGGGVVSRKGSRRA